MIHAELTNYTLKFSEITKIVSKFYVISPHWHDTGSLNPSLNKTRTYLFHKVNIIGAEVPARQGVRASTTMIITGTVELDYFSPCMLRVNCFPPEWLHENAIQPVALLCVYNYQYAWPSLILDAVCLSKPTLCWLMLGSIALIFIEVS